MKPFLGSLSEIEERLASAQSSGLIKLKQISENLGVEVEGVDLRAKLSNSKGPRFMMR